MKRFKSKHHGQALKDHFAAYAAKCDPANGDTIRLSDDPFVELFQPIMEDDQGSPKHFDPYSPEGRKEWKDPANDKLIWSVLDCDSRLYVTPGRHTVNLYSFFLCKVPWQYEFVEVFWG